LSYSSACAALLRCLGTRTTQLRACSWTRSCSVDVPASVIDVGAVEGIGRPADNTKTFKRSKWLDSAVMSQLELSQTITITILASDRAKSEPNLCSVIARHRWVPDEAAIIKAFRSEANFMDRRLAIYSNQDSRVDVDDAGAGPAPSKFYRTGDCG
jgi:hypothetical protein